MYVHVIKLNNRKEKDFSSEKPHGMADFLYLVIKAPSILTIKTQVFTINTPTAMLINSNTPYKYIALNDDYEDDYYHFALNDKQKFIDELTFPFNNPINLIDYKSIYDILTLICNEFDNQDENSQSEKSISLLTRYLMIKTGQQWNNINAENTETPHYDILKEIKEFIINNPEKNLTIKDLAERAHLSPAYFQVLYRKTFGSTCINDVINARISHAKDLLISTNYSVNTIAGMIGYNEVYHFIRQFKKQTGLTPGVFRKKF